MYCFADCRLRALPGLNVVSEIHVLSCRLYKMLDPVNEAEATYDYELIMTFLGLSTILFRGVTARYIMYLKHQKQKFLSLSTKRISTKLCTLLY